MRFSCKTTRSKNIDRQDELMLFFTTMIFIVKYVHTKDLHRTSKTYVTIIMIIMGTYSA